MLQTLYLLDFNNYYNRQVKGQNFTIIDEYEDYVVEGPIVAVNFNPNDGINTKHTLNSAVSGDGVDYLIVVDADTNKIKSRWFVIQSKRELAGQYTLSLRRDLMVDYYQDVINSTAYIQKAYISSTSDPFIYNSEGFQVNQIKKNELLLKDSTGSAWIVGYMASDYDGSTEGTRKKISSRTADIRTEYAFSKSQLETLAENLLFGDPEQVDVSFRCSYSYQFNGQKYMLTEIYNNGTHKKIEESGVQSINFDVKALEQVVADFSKIPTDNFYSQFYDYFTQITNRQTLINQLSAMSGKLVKNTDDNTYFSFTFERVPQIQTAIRKLPVNSGFYTEITDYLSTIPNLKFYTGPYEYYIEGKLPAYTIKNIEVATGETISVEMPLVTERMPLEDAPYDMFCIPYHAITYWTGSAYQQTDPTATLNIAQALATSMGSSIYDIQLLPYCPCIEYFIGSSLSLDDLTEHIHYSSIKNAESETISFLLWCRKSSFTNNIVYPFQDESGSAYYTIPTDPIKFKVKNECDKFRIVSPNYAGAFEFSATKNGGFRNVEVNCTYKPVQPYIHLNPTFGGLYGGDYNDNRGLICGGNFSLPIINDAWETYQIQNKSYMEAFNRQIENMETTFDINRQQARISAVVSGLGGTMSAGAASSMMGAGPVGVGVTSVLAAGANIAGAVADEMFAQRLQAESMDYTKDMFNFSLQNIQALPNTMSRTSAFDINNKLFPFVEYYTCTDKEKEALRNKLKYNGMTVMAIGRIADWIWTEPKFIQASIIRIELDEPADYHLSSELANELYKGVYL